MFSLNQFLQLVAVLRLMNYFRILSPSNAYPLYSELPTFSKIHLYAPGFNVFRRCLFVQHRHKCLLL